MKRIPELKTLECYECEQEFETDIDLDNILMAHILRFPNVFWNLCDEHKREKYDYTRDEAVAFQLIEGTCTEHELLSAGCTREDLKHFRQAGIKRGWGDYKNSPRRKRRRGR